MTEQSCSGSDSSASPPLWEFVPTGDYTVPAARTQKSTVEAWLSLQEIFRRKDVTDAPFKAEHDLNTLSRVLLEQRVPPLPWADAAAALDKTLQNWMASACRTCFSA